MSEHTKRKEVLKAINKAVRATEKARIAVAGMNAEVATYWKSQGNHPSMSADDCERAAQLASNLVRHLSYRALEEDF